LIGNRTIQAAKKCSRVQLHHPGLYIEHLGDSTRIELPAKFFRREQSLAGEGSDMPAFEESRQVKRTRAPNGGPSRKVLNGNGEGVVRETHVEPSKNSGDVAIKAIIVR